LDPGAGLEIAFFTADGHRFYRHVFRSFGQVFVHTPEVRGRANPFSTVEVTVLTAAGAEKAAGTAVADGEGRFRLSVRSGGATARIEPGDVVRLTASGESPEILVEEMTFDFTPQGGLVGIAPPDRDVEVRVTLEDGRELSIAQHTDAAGRFTYGRADLPPRADWDFQDIRVIQAGLPTANGHEIAAEVALEAVPPPTGGFQILLPWAGTS
jgi:hypothetical protein